MKLNSVNEIYFQNAVFKCLTERISCFVPFAGISPIGISHAIIPIGLNSYNDERIGLVITFQIQIAPPFRSALLTLSVVALTPTTRDFRRSAFHGPYPM